MGSSRREEALKKPSALGSASGNLPSPPREHEESPGEQPPRSANARLHANVAAAAAATLTHLSQHHRLVFLGTWPLLLGRCSGMVRRYGGHARCTAAGIASLASCLLIAANAISRRQWHKLVLSAGLRSAAVPRGAGKYLHAANCRVLVACRVRMCVCVFKEIADSAHRLSQLLQIIIIVIIIIILIVSIRAPSSSSPGIEPGVSG